MSRSAQLEAITTFQPKDLTNQEQPFKMSHLRKLIYLSGLMLSTACFTQTTYYSRLTDGTAGTWADPNNWSTVSHDGAAAAAAPGTTASDDIVIIGDQDHIEYNANDGTSNSLTIGSITIGGSETGSLRFPFSNSNPAGDLDDLNASYTLNVTGDFIVNANGSVLSLNGGEGSPAMTGGGSNRTHDLLIGGNLTIAGTFDLERTTARDVELTFNSTDDQTISESGSPTVDVYEITYNLQDAADQVILASAAFSNAIDRASVFTNGTFVHNNTGTYSNPLNATQSWSMHVEIQSGTFIMTSPSNDRTVTINGNLTVSGGTISSGNNGVGGSADTNLTLNGTLTMTGGLLNVGNGDGTTTNRPTDGQLTINGTGTSSISNAAVFAYNYDQGADVDLTISGTSVVDLAGNVDFTDINVSGSASISAGTNGTADETDIEGNAIFDGSGTLLFDQGLIVQPGGALTLNSNTLNIYHTSSANPGTIVQIYDNFTMNGGTLNVANAATALNDDAFEILNNSTVSLNDGTVNFFSSLTNIDNWTNGDMIDVQATTSQMFIGDGDATPLDLNIAENLTSGTQADRNGITVNANDGLVRLQSDADVQIGGSIYGRFYCRGDAGSNDEDTHLLVEGGTLNIAHELFIDNGMGVEITGGTVNIGLNTTDGSGTIDFELNPSAPTYLEVSGGTVNIGDGSSGMVIGNGGNPVHGTVDAFQRFSLLGGTFNLFGRFALNDHNARFEMGDAIFNVDPRGDLSIGDDVSTFDLHSGIVINSTTTGGTITIIDPLAGEGAGVAMQTSDQGTGGCCGNGRLSSSTSGSAPVDFTGISFHLGNGISSVAGSTEGFDLDLSSDHTYGTFVIDNPTGSNRFVKLIKTGEAYSMSGDLTITAGVLDMQNNTIDRNATGGSFTLGATSELLIGNTDGSNHFPGSTTAFSSYTVDVTSTITYNGAGNQEVDIPGSAEFGNLTIAGSGTKNLSAAESVNGTLLLTAGDFTANDNLTLGNDSRITLDAGTFAVTTAIQGSNDYTIEYIGSGKNTGSAEFSGAGTKNLIMNLNSSSELLTLDHAAATVNDATFTEGTLVTEIHDLSIEGDLTQAANHSGAGAILILDGIGTHTLSGDGTGQFHNITVNSANPTDVSTALEVTGTFTLTNGLFNINNNLLNLSSSAADFAGGGVANHIQTSGSAAAAGVTKTFLTVTSTTSLWPIGTMSAGYTPATLDILGTASGGTLTIKPVDSPHPLTTDANNLELGYYWSVTATGLSTPTANLSFTYDQTDVQGSESTYIAARFLSPTWTTINDINSVNESTNEISFSGVNYLDGDFTAGEPSEFGVVLNYFSRTSGDWNDPNSWSNASLGGPAASTIPGSSSAVIIGNSHTITASSNEATAGALEIQSSGTLRLAGGTTGHTFGMVTGNGSLELISNTTTAPEFPGGTFASFLSADGGTVSYLGTGDYTLPISPLEYFNLRIGGGGEKTLPAQDLNLLGSLTVDGATTVLISDALDGDLSIAEDVTISAAGGTLRFPETTSRFIQVGGTVSIANATASFDVVGTGSAVHQLSIGGDLSNNGVFDMSTGGSTVVTTFTGTSDNAISGMGGTTNFHRLLLNKGTSSSTLLDVTASNLSFAQSADQVDKPLEIQNGTFRLSAPLTVTLSTSGDFNIPTSGGLSLNHASAVAEITTNSGDLRLLGLLELMDGTLNIGDDVTGSTDNDLIYVGTAGELAIQGGTLNVSGKIQPTETSLTPNDAISYHQSGGLLRVARYTVTNSMDNDGDADFSIENTASSFTMSGGTIEIIRGVNGGDGKAIKMDGNMTHNVTGGTLHIITSATTGTSAGDDVGYSIGVPIYNLVVGGGTGFTGDVGGPFSGRTDLVVLNDLTLNLGGKLALHRAQQTFAQEPFNLNLGGNLTIQNGTFSAGSNRPCTFDGSGTTQTITVSGGGTVDFQDLVFDNPGGTLQPGSNTHLAVDDDWTFNAGTFDGVTNSGTVTFDGSTTQRISGSVPLFYDLVIDNGSGVTLEASSMTVSNELTLTSGILNIGLNALELTSTSASAISGTPSVSAMIVSTGSGAAGVTKSYPDAVSDFTFPIGTGSLYTPVRLNQTTANGAGTLTVNPIGTEHPTAAGAAGALDYFWEVSSTGLGAATAFTHEYSYDESDVGGDTEANYNAAAFDGSVWTEDTDNVNESSNVITFSTTGPLNADYTAAEGLMSPTIYYSRNATGGGNWSDGSTWSTTGHGGVAAGSSPTASNPVLIANGHTVTVQDGTIARSSSTSVGGILNALEEDLSTLGEVLGTGTLQLSPATASTPSLPTINAAFLVAGGGTIEYASSNSYSLPSLAAYHNVAISGGGTKTLQMDAVVSGDLTINAGTLDLRTFSLDRATTGGTMALGANTTLDVNEADNFPANYASYSLDVSSTVTYDEFNDQQIAAVTYGNLTLVRRNGTAREKQLTGNTIITGDLTIGRGAVLITNDFDLRVEGNWIRDTRDASGFTPGSGTVTFGGATAQSLSYSNTAGLEDEVFHHLVLDNASGFTFPTQMTSLTIAGDLTVTAGTIDFNSEDFTLTGDLTIHGNLANPGTVTFNANDANQTIDGSVVPAFGNLTVAKAPTQKLIVANDVGGVIIDGVLTLENEGIIELTGTNNDLTMGSGGSISSGSGSFSSTRMIVVGGTATASSLIQTGTDNTPNAYDFVFPIGVGARYTPVTVDASAVTDAADGLITVRPIVGNSTIGVSGVQGSSTEAIDYYFIVDLTDISSLTGAWTFTYDDSDIQGTEINYLTRYYNGASWQDPEDVGNGSGTNTSLNNAGLNQYGGSATTVLTSATSEWITGSNDAFFSILYSTNPFGGNWSSGTSWTVNSDGTDDGQSTVPTADNSVVLLPGHTVTTDLDGQSAASVELQGTAVLDLAANNTINHDFGALTGTGTLLIGTSGGTTSNFPDFSSFGTDFFNSSGGTVEYRDGTILLTDKTLQYNHLVIGGTSPSTKTLSSNIAVQGDLTINAGITLDADAVNDYDIAVGGDLVNNGTFEPRNGTFTMNGTGLQSLPLGVTFNNLIFDNTGPKTIGTPITIANDFTILAASGTVDMGTNALTVSGDFSGTAAFSHTGTVTLDNTSALQTIASNGIIPFSTLVLDKNGQDVNLIGDFSTAVSLIIDDADLSGPGDISVAGTWIMNTPSTFAGTGTVTFNGDGASAQNIYSGTETTVTFQGLTIDIASTGGSNDQFDFDGVTLNGAGNLTINDGTLQNDGADRPIDVVNMEIAAAGTLDATNMTTINLSGDWTNAGIFTNTGTTVNFDGATAQTTTGATTFNNVTKSGGGDLTLNDDMTVDGTLTLTDGDIYSDLANTLTLGSSASISGGSASSHVSTAMARTLASATLTTHDFPLGDGTVYRPISMDLDPADATSRVYTASLMTGAPTDRVDPVGIDHVSSIRYYNITQSPSATLDAGTIRITYNPDDNVLNTSTLRLVKDDGAGNWIDLGGSVAGDTDNGTIASTLPFTTFSDFVLASSIADASLPVELVYFRAEEDENDIVLEWGTASELNNDYFTIERSGNGTDFVSLAQVQGNGTSAHFHRYEFRDAQPLNGVNFYRLSQTDFDGTREIFEIISVQRASRKLQIDFYPNPVTDLLTLTANVPFSGIILVTDLSGKVLLEKHAISSGSFYLDTSFLAPGLYQVSVSYAEEKKTFRVLKK